MPRNPNQLAQLCLHVGHDEAFQKLRTRIPTVSCGTALSILEAMTEWDNWRDASIKLQLDTVSVILERFAHPDAQLALVLQAYNLEHVRNALLAQKKGGPPGLFVGIVGERPDPSTWRHHLIDAIKMSMGDRTAEGIAVMFEGIANTLGGEAKEAALAMADLQRALPHCGRGLLLAGVAEIDEKSGIG